MFASHAMDSPSINGVAPSQKFGMLIVRYANDLRRSPEPRDSAAISKAHFDVSMNAPCVVDTDFQSLVDHIEGSSPWRFNRAMRVRGVQCWKAVLVRRTIREGQQIKRCDGLQILPILILRAWHVDPWVRRNDVVEGKDERRQPLSNPDSHASQSVWSRD